MTAPLYFIPHVDADTIAPGSRLNQRLIAARGLGHVFGDLTGPQVDCSLTRVAGRGPEKLSGVILCALPHGGEPPRRLGYYPEEQTWHAGEVIERDAAAVAHDAAAEGPLDCPPFFLGLDSAEPPRPADVARKQVIAGHAVELADGQSWQVPLLRAPGGGTNLPRSLGWHAGQFEPRVKRQYRAAWEASEDTALLFYGGGENSRDYEQIVLRCLQALGLNYRLGPVEQTVLELVDTANWEAVLGATVDLPTVIAAAKEIKKKRDSAPPPETPESPPSSPGGRDSPPLTGLAGANCTSPA